MSLYAEMTIKHRPDRMSARVEKRIGAPHDPEVLKKTRLADVPLDSIDYAVDKQIYRLVGFKASTIEYQLRIESDQYDLIGSCETVWRALAGGPPWDARPRLLELSVSDEASNTTVLRGSTGIRAALRPDSIGLLCTGALALVWLIGGLLIADSSVQDDIAIGASPPLIAAVVTAALLIVGSRRGLVWRAQS